MCSGQKLMDLHTLGQLEDKGGGLLGAWLLSSRPVRVWPHPSQG